jgi:hypothetical protein
MVINLHFSSRFVLQHAKFTNSNLLALRSSFNNNLVTYDSSRNTSHENVNCSNRIMGTALYYNTKERSFRVLKINLKIWDESHQT